MTLLVVVAVGIAMVECVMDCMLLIVHWLNIVLIVKRVVELVVSVMVTVVFSFEVSGLHISITMRFKGMLVLIGSNISEI